jgi:hypothetical protein
MVTPHGFKTAPHGARRSFHPLARSNRKVLLLPSEAIQALVPSQFEMAWSSLLPGMAIEYAPPFRPGRGVLRDLPAQCTGALICVNLWEGLYL